MVCDDRGGGQRHRVRGWRADGTGAGRFDERLAALEGATVCYVGYGNIHVVVVFARSIDRPPEACEAIAATTNVKVHEQGVAMSGSIAAEHGVGLMHRGRLGRFKPALGLAMMRQIKLAFDPQNLMNPGKILVF